MPVRLLLGILFAVVPLALVPGWFLSHDVIPKVILLLAGAALILLILPDWVAGLQSLRNRRPGRYFLLLVLAQLVSLAVSTALSTQLPLSIAGTVWRRFGLIEQIAILVIACATASVINQQPDSLRFLFRSISTGGGIAALYGIAQYVGFDPFLSRQLYALDYLGGIVRPPATMGHAIYFSAYLVPVTLLAVYGYMSETNVAWKYAAGCVGILAPIAIVLSGTRASLLALAAGAVFFVFRSRSGHLARTLAKGAIWIIPIVMLIVLSPAGSTFRHRLQQWREDLGGPRIGVWRDSATLIAEHPLFGTGPETFAVEFRKVESPELSRAYPDFYHETPHNAFIDAATGQGLPGALILAAFVALVFWRRTELADASLQATIQAALFGMLLGSLFASWTLVTGLFLWVLAGVLAGLLAGKSLAKPASASQPIPKLWRIPAGLLAAVFVVIAALLGAQDFYWSNLEDAVADKDFQEAETAYSAATAFSAGMPGYELWGSREFAILGRSLGSVPGAALAWRKAGDASALAEKQGEEKFSAAYQSSVLAVASADLPRAESKARDAIVLAPNWYKPHLLLAQILQGEGNGEGASREAQLSVNLGWRQNR
jgi:O-antigen ligase